MSERNNVTFWRSGKGTQQNHGAERQMDVCSGWRRRPQGILDSHYTPAVLSFHMGFLRAGWAEYHLIAASSIVQYDTSITLPLELVRLS